MNIILKPQPNDRKNINATCRKMMRAFGHIVATCWDMLGVFGSSLNGQMCAKNTQHVATGWLNARQILRLTMLRYIALKCCNRLAVAFRKSFKKIHGQLSSLMDHLKYCKVPYSKYLNNFVNSQHTEIRNVLTFTDPTSCRTI